ncbi:MAG: hypothetical protein WCQ90_08190 [Deltaproteobacteria bacterium]
MPERWDCIFVEKISPKGRVYLTKPLKYGYMYTSHDGTPAEKPKVRKSIPSDCGPIKGLSNESKILSATAIATALNRSDIKLFEGLIIRGFKGRPPFPGLQTALIKTHGKTLREEGTTEWIVYVSRKEEFYYVVDDKSLGETLSAEHIEKINACISYIETEWLKGGWG